MESKTIEIAALGRSLSPGMLYDCRSDSFIPGVTLWDKTSLKNDLDVILQPKTDAKFCASDSLSEKANFLEVNASLKASFLGGLVEVGGSAKFLRDSKSSMNQSRVSLMFNQTTKFEQLTMTQLGNITYPQVFEQKTATHVVTATLYGAQAFMVFDHKASTAEEKQEVEGNLNAVVNKFPSFSIAGQASLTLNENEKKVADELSVTFHGDFHLENPPTTFSEALDVYKKLPSLLNKENVGVPIKVWLYPLELLDKNAATLVREISTRLLSNTERIVEQFAEAKRRCNDLLESQTVQNFPTLKTRVQKFQDFYTDYELVFQKALCRVLPAIRGGGEEERALAEILEIHNKSPLADNKLNKWLESVTTEMQILNSATKGLKDIKVVTSSGQLSAILFDPDVEVLVCLTFTSLTENDDFLPKFEKFLTSEPFVKLDQIGQETRTRLSSPFPWFTQSKMPKKIRENISLFKSFAEANKGKEKMQFIIASIRDNTSLGISIYLYENGSLTNPKYQPVSKPPPPTLMSGESLKLQKSPTGETVRYRVEYKQVNTTKTGAEADEGKWKFTETPDAEETFTLTELQPQNQYLVRYRAVCKEGVSEASESILFTPKTTPEIMFPKDQERDCVLVGGYGGNDFTLLSAYASMALQKIKVSVGDNQVNAIYVNVSTNQVTFGIPSNRRWKEFEFLEGDRFRLLEMWPNLEKTLLAGLRFVIMRKNGHCVEFLARAPYFGQSVSIDVHSGICCGIKGRSGYEIDAFGFIFVKN